jgi:hypothetical protein
MKEAIDASASTQLFAPFSMICVMSAPVSPEGGHGRRRLPPRTNRDRKRIPKKDLFAESFCPLASSSTDSQPGIEGRAAITEHANEANPDTLQDQA